MTKEQEAIKLLKDFTKMDFSNPIGWTGYYNTELKELSQAVETVLSMLKEKDKELEKKDRIIDLMVEHIAFCKNINSYEDIKTYKRQIKQYFENKEKE